MEQMMPIPREEDLSNLYWQIGLSLPKISKLYGVVPSTIWCYMKKYGIPTRSDKRIGIVGNVGNNHPAWKGGRFQTSRGYIKASCRKHPFADQHGYVLEHRLVVEKYIDHYIPKNSCVHHKNGIRNDNRIENLLLCTNSQHKKMHIEARNEQKN